MMGLLGGEISTLGEHSGRLLSFIGLGTSKVDLEKSNIDNLSLSIFDKMTSEGRSNSFLGK